MIRRVCETVRCCGSFYKRTARPGEPFPPGHEYCCHCQQPLQWKPSRRWRYGARDTVDYELPQNGGAKTDRIDLGLALLSALKKRNAEFTHADIAAWCGCSEGYIWQVERRALRRLRQTGIVALIKENGGIREGMGALL